MESISAERNADRVAGRDPFKLERSEVMNKFNPNGRVRFYSQLLQSSRVHVCTWGLVQFRRGGGIYTPNLYLETAS